MADTATESWADVLADWSAWLVELERALDEDDWGVVAAAGDWAPPAASLPDATDDETRRGAALQVRADALRVRLEAAMAETAAESGEARRRMTAARRYARDGR